MRSFALTAAALVMLSNVANADPTSRTVVLTVNAPAPEARVLEGTVRELLARMNLVLGSTPHPLAIAQVDIDPTSNTAHVQVTREDGTRLVDRQIARETNAIQREQVAQAIRMAAESQLLPEPIAEAEDHAIAPIAPPAPAPTPAPPPAPAPASLEQRDTVTATPNAPPNLGVSVALLGGAAYVAQGTPIARVGGSATVSLRQPLHPSLTLSGFYAFPFTTALGEVESRSILTSGRAMASIEPIRYVEVGVGGGFDVLSVEPTSDTLPARVIGPETTRVSPILSASAGARIPIMRDVTMRLALLVDTELGGRRYVFSDHGTQRDVLSPWNVRPMLLASFAFDLR